ncbi:Molybdopterin biosynthesis protein MoeA [invertebrate metagenome]|uniref:molybdopterin molybdotransferase n=1 Tax=invertebrate metagenome TaxID=1711999 RepID=A0A484H5S3_9ZZZZ
MSTSCSTSLSVEQAIQAVRAQAHCRLATEPVPLTVALGRVLAEDLIAPLSLPPYDNAAVDGYGIRSTDQAGLPRRVVSRAAAGVVAECPIGPGEAVRLFTGSLLPHGVDAVVMQEECQAKGDLVLIPAGVASGTNCRRAGEDVRRGHLALTAGMRLRPQDLGFIAAMGLSTLPVRAPLRVALFSTGDELREPGNPLPPGCIYDANRRAIAACLTALGCAVTDLGMIPDQVTAVTAALREAILDHDLLVTSGGMSVGEEDHVRTAVSDIGTLHLWSVKIKPGKPIAIGTVADVPFLGLPGNPVAAMVAFLIIGRPLVLTLAGRSFFPPPVYPMPAGFVLTRSPGRREFLRVCLDTGSDGVQQVILCQMQGAAVLSSMSRADGFVDLAETVEKVQPGEMLRFLSLSDLLW